MITSNPYFYGPTISDIQYFFTPRSDGAPSFISRVENDYGGASANEEVSFRGEGTICYFFPYNRGKKMDDIP